MNNGGDVDAKTKNHPHRAFATVVGNCPFAHVGGADLARVALNQQPVKSPLYRAFESFAGVGIFTAEGEDWAAKRSEVLGAFASAGLEPLAAASKRSASKLTAEIDAKLAAEKDVEKGLPKSRGEGARSLAPGCKWRQVCGAPSRARPQRRKKTAPVRAK